MLALARAVMQRPKLLLLDEPSLGLAPLVTAEIFRIVRELNEREGTAILIVEQNARTSLATAARAYVLEVGRVAFEGTSEELSSRDTIRRRLPGVLMATLSIKQRGPVFRPTYRLDRPVAASSSGCVCLRDRLAAERRSSRSRRSPASRTAASTRASRSRSSSSTARPR